MQEFLIKKTFLVEDNAGWHRSKKVETHAGIIVDYLPAYSPELQPAERLWTLVDGKDSGQKRLKCQKLVK